jgi:hypothetical protein
MDHRPWVVYVIGVACAGALIVAEVDPETASVTMEFTLISAAARRARSV